LKGREVVNGSAAFLPFGRCDCRHLQSDVRMSPTIQDGTARARTMWFGLAVIEEIRVQRYADHRRAHLSNTQLQQRRRLARRLRKQAT